MSDEESYEYEYDDDASDHFEYTDDEEQEDDDSNAALENLYYSAKGYRDSNEIDKAISTFEEVIGMEENQINNVDGNNDRGNSRSQWTYKCLKQLVKLYMRIGHNAKAKESYERLLESMTCLAQSVVEKGISSILERVSSLFQQGGVNPTSTSSTSLNLSDGNLSPQLLARHVYDATIRVFHPTSGHFPNERLWFKTNLKYGQLLYDMNETAKLQHIINDLLQRSNQTSITNTTSSTNLMEIYALQIQLYSRLKDNTKLREIFNKAMHLQGGIPHPRTLALIQELAGKMHMASREFEAAGKTFFQAFKSYDEAGDVARLRCLKYLLLANMLHASVINPFDSQEVKPYQKDPQIMNMNTLVKAYHDKDIQIFEQVLTKNQGMIMDDEFMREYFEDLLKTMRTQVLQKVIQPYTRISLAGISKKLNDVSLKDVEGLLVSLIMDGTLNGKIDQIHGIFVKDVTQTITPASRRKPGLGDVSNETVSKAISTNTVTSKTSKKFGEMDAMYDLMSEVENLTMALGKIGVVV